MKYEITLNKKYIITGPKGLDDEEILDRLEYQITQNNNTVECEFWDNLKLKRKKIQGE